MAANLTFLGSGSAFTVGADNFQSNAILTLDNGKKFLIDCGTDIRFSLYALGLSHRDITDIYVSHLHSDHVGGLEYVGFSTMFDPNCGKPNLYLSQDIAADLWERSLAGGMEAIEGGMTEVDSYFQIHALGPGETFTWENVNFQLIKLNHVDTGSMLMPAYGLFSRSITSKFSLATTPNLATIAYRNISMGPISFSMIAKFPLIPAPSTPITTSCVNCPPPSKQKCGSMATNRGHCRPRWKMAFWALLSGVNGLT
ncbi:MBL fold metallo-hydrolase [Synechocystis sp. B12]|nr:MBL fold metallo-hydrolase [Synechocystis sp. B12]